jgi:putative membrane protein
MHPMYTASTALTALVAALHGYFLVLEMFYWDRPAGRRIFRTTAEFAAASKTLAANQGLYNGFLAAGLIWGLALGTQGVPVRVFFLSCVLVAGIYGGATVNRRIWLVQGAPAALALVATLLN